MSYCSHIVVEQVLRLVHYLVMYGYYGNTDDIKQLMEPLVDLLDGRNDKPYLISAGKGDSKLYKLERTTLHYFVYRLGVISSQYVI